jgi:hypothetical protein
MNKSFDNFYQCFSNKNENKIKETFEKAICEYKKNVPSKPWFENM